jgi:hypothetical protein
MWNLIGESFQKPLTTNDIYIPMNAITHFKGAKMLCLRLIVRKEINSDDIELFKVAIQETINARIRDGYLIGCHWAVPKKRHIPLLKIVDFHVTGAFAYINILLTNTEQSANAAEQEISTIAKLNIDDTDPLF